MKTINDFLNKTVYIPDLENEAIWLDFSKLTDEDRILLKRSKGFILPIGKISVPNLLQIKVFLENDNTFLFTRKKDSLEGEIYTYGCIDNEEVNKLFFVFSKLRVKKDFLLIKERLEPVYPYLKEINENVVFYCDCSKLAVTHYNVEDGKLIIHMEKSRGWENKIIYSLPMDNRPSTPVLVSKPTTLATKFRNVFVEKHLDMEYIEEIIYTK